LIDFIVKWLKKHT